MARKSTEHMREEVDQGADQILTIWKTNRQKQTLKHYGKHEEGAQGQKVERALEGKAKRAEGGQRVKGLRRIRGTTRKPKHTNTSNKSVTAKTAHQQKSPQDTMQHGEKAFNGGGGGLGGLTTKSRARRWAPSPPRWLGSSPPPPWHWRGARPLSATRRRPERRSGRCPGVGLGWGLGKGVRVGGGSWGGLGKGWGGKCGHMLQALLGLGWVVQGEGAGFP